MDYLPPFGDRNPLASGDPRDWDRLVEVLGPASLLVAIERRMSAMLRSRLSPEDVFQEALLHAWRDRNRCEWRGVRAYRRWFLGVIENRIRDAADREGAMKRGGAAPRLAVSDLTPALVANDGEARRFLEGLATTTPSRVALVREEAQIMRAALAELPDELRSVLELRIIEELSTEETAERLGLGVSAVKHRLRRGAGLYRERLRAAFQSRSSAS